MVFTKMDVLLVLFDDFVGVFGRAGKCRSIKSPDFETGLFPTLGFIKRYVL